MKVPTEAELIVAISDATRKALSELFREYPDHHFYYCSLITSVEGHPPVLAAWSEEALIAKAAELGYEGDEVSSIRWSYADSPFYCYGEQHFDRVVQLFEARPQLDFDALAQWEAEYAVGLRAMEAAMAQIPFAQG